MWGEQEPLGTEASGPLPQGAEEGLAPGAAAAFSIWQRTLDLALHVNPESARLRCPDWQPDCGPLADSCLYFQYAASEKPPVFLSKPFRPHPMICAFKLALLIAKVLKLSLGVSESGICLFAC